MRLITILSSQFISNDLASEFGRIIPCELPLANKRLLFHQIKSINEIDYQDCILTIPNGYNHLLDGIKTLECPSNLNVRDVIQFVFQNYQDYNSYIFYFGDTLLNFSFKENALYYGDSSFQYPSWFRLEDNNIFAGVFSIEKKTLKNSLNNSTTVNEFLDQLNSRLDSAKAEKWFDFGNYTSYYNSKKRFFQSREFNDVKIIDDTLILKSSKDIAKMFYEYSWLEKYSKLLPSHCPNPRNFNIINDRAQYELEYYALPSLSDLLVFGKNDDEFWIKVLTQCRELLSKLYSSSFNELKNLNFYSRKLSERIKYFNKNHFLIDNSFISSQLDIASYLDEQDNTVKPSHGDFCFSNILYDVRNQNLKIIDPRGYCYRELGAFDILPKNYDIFKLAHSYVGFYDDVIANVKMPVLESPRIEVFNQIFDIKEKLLYAGLSHLFFTMIPLHEDNTDRQKIFLKISKLFYASYSNCR